MRPYNRVFEIGLWEFIFLDEKNPIFFDEKNPIFFDGKNPIFLDKKNPIFLDGKNPFFLKEKIRFFRWIKSDFENPIVRSYMWWRVDGWGVFLSQI